MGKITRITRNKEYTGFSYFSENDNLFILPQISFPNHYKVQEWLNGNDLNDDFELVITEIEGRNGLLNTVSALGPQSEQIKFIWMLKGVEKLQQEILDFKKE